MRSFRGLLEVPQDPAGSEEDEIFSGSFGSTTGSEENEDPLESPGFTVDPEEYDDFYEE